MEQYRRRIQRDPKALEKLVRKFNKQDTFRLEGECYKRPKGETTPLLTPWYNRKYISLIAGNEPDDLLCSPDLVGALADGYQELLPFYRYFNDLHLEPPIADKF